MTTFLLKGGFTYGDFRDRLARGGDDLAERLDGWAMARCLFPLLKHWNQ